MINAANFQVPSSYTGAHVNNHVKQSIQPTVPFFSKPQFLAAPNVVVPPSMPELEEDLPRPLKEDVTLDGLLGMAEVEDEDMALLNVDAMDLGDSDMSILMGFLHEEPNVPSEKEKELIENGDEFMFDLMENIPTESLIEEITCGDDLLDPPELEFAVPQMKTPQLITPNIPTTKPKGSSKRLCKAEGCTKRSRSQGYCIAHGGGKRCIVEGCNKSSQGGDRCIKHGGGRRCIVEGCTKAAQTKNRCKAHGGGPRCKFEGCNLSSQGRGYCRTHGGGKRCCVEGCTKGTQRGNFCAFHGGSKYCQVNGCHRNDRGGGYCATHGGGKRCTISGCDRPCRRAGLCSLHVRVMEN